MLVVADRVCIAVAQPMFAVAPTADDARVEQRTGMIRARCEHGGAAAQLHVASGRRVFVVTNRIGMTVAKLPTPVAAPAAHGSVVE